MDTTDKDALLSDKLLIAFYIPLDHPLAVEPNVAFHARRKEPVDWLADAPWPDEYKKVTEILRDTNFVMFRLGQFIGRPRFDFSAGNAAIAMAVETTTGIKPAPGNSIRQEEDGTGQQFVLQTIVEVRTVLIHADDGTVQGAIIDAFERVNEELRHLEIAAQLSSKTPLPGSTNRINLFPLIPYSLFDPWMNKWTEVSLMMVNEGFGYFPQYAESLSEDEVQRMTLRWQQLRIRNPLYDYAKASYSAGRLLEFSGDFSLSVVQLHTAGEIFLDSLLLALAWEELEYFDKSTLTRKDVYNWFSKRSSLESRLRKHYHRRLKGWDPEDRSGPLYQWLDEVSLLRNRVVHAGYEATEQEARRAREIMSSLEAFVKDALLTSDQNRNRYPRTALVFVSREGMQRRGKYSRKIRELDDASLDGDWIGELIEFKAWLNGELLLNKGNEVL